MRRRPVLKLVSPAWSISQSSPYFLFWYPVCRSIFSLRFNFNVVSFIAHCLLFWCPPATLSYQQLPELFIRFNFSTTKPCPRNDNHRPTQEWETTTFHIPSFTPPNPQLSFALVKFQFKNHRIASNVCRLGWVAGHPPPDFTLQVRSAMVSSRSYGVLNGVVTTRTAPT